jgi:hypothetical protein
MPAAVITGSYAGEMTSRSCKEVKVIDGEWNIAITR